MGAIVDIIIVAIIAYTVIMSVKRGFVKTVIGTLGFFLAIIVALMFCSTLSGFLEESGFGTSVSNAVDSAVDGLINEENYHGIFETEDGEESALLHICKTFGAEGIYNDISENYNEWRAQGLVSAKNYIKDAIRAPAVDLCCSVLSFLLLFIVARILIKIAEIVVGKIVDLPVLKQANSLLGGVAGVLLAVVRVYIACLVLKWIIPVASSFGWDWASKADLSDSVLYTLFESGNFLSKLI